MKYFSFLIFFILGSFQLSGQNLDEELGFIYVKADYLLETDRYEESILEFSKIVDREPGFKDALFKRATAKYALAAYRGVKQDILKSFEHTGVTPESILLYGKALDAMGETESASKTMKTASVFYPDDKKASKYKDPEEDRVVKNDDTDSNNEESNKEEGKSLEDKISSILKDLLPDEEKVSDSDQNPDDGSTSDNSGNQTESKPKVYVPDNSINEIYIDEDLTLEIKNGLGNRKVLEQPNILILSESAGDVSVEVCVNRNGKVTSAEYNQTTSNLDIQSLISLAVRKSKEFWFEKSDRKETCGTIIFHISGRN